MYSYLLYSNYSMQYHQFTYIKYIKKFTLSVY